MERIARTTRGGYCFQLNGALAGLLTALGYEATLHVAGVHGDAGAAAAMGNHAAVVVHSLPTEANPGGRWYVDAGLGDVLHEPLPLRAWRGSDAYASYELAPVSDGVGHWRLGARSPGGVAAVTMDARPTAIGAFRARHLFNATSGESSFARTVTAQRRHATGTDVLRGCVLTRRDGTLVSSDTFTSCATWLAALDDVFGMRLDVGRPALDDLWARRAGQPRGVAGDEPGRRLIRRPLLGHWCPEVGSGTLSGHRRRAGGRRPRPRAGRRPTGRRRPPAGAGGG